jgi:hypothetical protein
VIGVGVDHFVSGRQVLHSELRRQTARDFARDRQHAVRLVRSHVEDLVVRCRFERRAGDHRRHVVDVREGAGLLAVSEDRQRLLLQALMHEDADHVSVFVREILALAVHVVGPKYDEIEAEQPLRRGEVELHGQLRNAVRIFRVRRELFAHRQLIPPVHGDGRREHEALGAVVHGGVDQVDASDQIGLVVESTHEVGQALGRIHRQTVDILAVAAGQIVDRHHIHSQRQAVLRDVRAHEACGAGDESSNVWHGLTAAA